MNDSSRHNTMVKTAKIKVASSATRKGGKEVKKAVAPKKLRKSLK